MRVRVTVPSKEGKRMKDKILALVSTVEDDDWSDNWELVRPCSIFSGSRADVHGTDGTHRAWEFQAHRRAASKRDQREGR